MLSALLVMTGIALVLGAALGYASIRFRVDGDPLVEKIDAILPQTQCGQCSYPGCKPYAQAIANGEAPAFGARWIFLTDLNGGSKSFCAQILVFSKAAFAVEPDLQSAFMDFYSVCRCRFRFPTRFRLGSRFGVDLQCCLRALAPLGRCAPPC